MISSAAHAVARLFLLVVAAIASIGLLAEPVGRTAALQLASEANPLVGAPFYVNPNSAAMRAANAADPQNPQLRAVADTPQAYWLVPGSSASTVAIAMTGRTRSTMTDPWWVYDYGQFWELDRRMASLRDLAAR